MMYTTGKFAKLANVSERTIRYYDKIGLLKPSIIQDNGYRKYNDNDFIRLQNILILKKLGFSLEEIETILLDQSSWVDSLQTQMELVTQKIKYFQNIKDILAKTIEIVKKQGISTEKTLELLAVLSKDDQLINQYKNSKNLRVRIHLHHLYSTNPVEWFFWLRQQINFSHVNRLLEVGCGNGDLWVESKIDLRNREFFLSDISQGMLEDAQQRLGEQFSYMSIDIEQIPFKKDFFDCVIANHVLFYVNDLDKGLKEVQRVLKSNGVLYASTYSNVHMKEITQLAKEFDPRITLSHMNLPERFGKENGEEILSRYFENIERRDYTDTLVIDQAKPIVDYIVSCHGNQNEILSGRIEEFYSFIKKKIDDQGSITVTKEACLFIAQNKYVKSN